MLTLDIGINILTTKIKKKIYAYLMTTLETVYFNFILNMKKKIEQRQRDIFTVQGVHTRNIIE